MALQDTDLLLVQRSSASYKMPASELSTYVGGGNSSVTVSATAPSTPENGDMWWNSNDGQLYIYYTDADTSQWVIATSDGGSSERIVVSENVPANANEADLWYSTDDARLYIYDGAVWIDASPAAAIGADAVSTASIQDGAVTPVKLSTGGPSWDTSGNLTVDGSASFGSGGVTIDSNFGGINFATGSNQTIRAVNSNSQQTSRMFFTDDGVDNITLATDGSASFADVVRVNSTSNVGSASLLRLGNANNSGNASAHLFLANGYFVSPSGIDGTGSAASIRDDGTATFAGAVSAPNACTAWVNFSGTSLGIRDSYNISTITRVSDGKYKVYFATPMDNADYCAQICSVANGQFIDNQETDYIGISTTNSSGVRADATITNVTIFGGKN